MNTLPNDAFKTINPSESGLGCKWYKFLVYFGLWAAAIINVFLGILYLCSCPYLGASKAVYADYPALQNTDFIYGLYRVIFGGFLFYTAWSMLKRKFEAPILLYGASLSSILTGFSYPFCAASNIISSLPRYMKEGVTSTFTSPFSAYPIRPTTGAEFLVSFYGFVIIVLAVAGLVWNMLYFNKRDNWFERKKAVKIKK